MFSNYRSSTKSFFITSIIVLLIFSFSFVPLIQAQTDFIGKSTGMIPCTCSAGTLQWRFVAPLYLSLVPIAGAMLTTLVPFIFAYNFWNPYGGDALGRYIPGANACMLGVPPYCTLLPALGTVTPYAGSSAY